MACTWAGGVCSTCLWQSPPVMTTRRHPRPRDPLPQCRFVLRILGNPIRSAKPSRAVPTGRVVPPGHPSPGGPNSTPGLARAALQCRLSHSGEFGDLMPVRTTYQWEHVRSPLPQRAIRSPVRRGACRPPAHPHRHQYTARGLPAQGRQYRSRRGHSSRQNLCRRRRPPTASRYLPMCRMAPDVISRVRGPPRSGRRLPSPATCHPALCARRGPNRGRTAYASSVMKGEN